MNKIKGQLSSSESLLYFHLPSKFISSLLLNYSMENVTKAILMEMKERRVPFPYGHFYISDEDALKIKKEILNYGINGKILS